MDRSRIGIVIPALNESATISGVVRAAGKFGVPIVVDDGSSDATATLAAEAGAVVVSHDSNRGYDAALNSGFMRTTDLGSDAIITLDADGQHDPANLAKMVALLDAGADVVVGIRNKRQRLAEHLFGWYTRLRFGIIDPLCGFKAYRVNVYRRLGHFDSYGSIGTELVIFAARKGYRISQMPLQIRERDGHPRFGRKFVANLLILRAAMVAVWRSC